MRFPRITIRTLFGVVLFAAVAAAALHASTDAWDSGILGMALLILLTAILLAVHRTDRRRAYWLGFALFGWTYLGASMIPPIWVRLPTTRGLARIGPRIPLQVATDWALVSPSSGFAALTYGYGGDPNPLQCFAVSPQGNPQISSSHAVVQVRDAGTGQLLEGPSATIENFIRIGHSLLALVLGFLGGHLSCYLHDWGHRQNAPVPPPT